MKKTLSISLANLNFVLEEDAYQKLVTYLEQIRIHFSNNPDKDEIVKDIEYSIADKFSKLLSPTKQVISIEDAERVMQEIGSTHDFTKTEMVNEEATSYTESEQTEKKRLYRDEEHQVIAGVCAGIANYFDVDVVWIRALFGVLLFTPLFGVVLIVYIILWLSTPPATNVVDKLKMQGEPVTLERIAAQIKDRVQQQDTPEKNIIKKIVSIPVIILTFVFKILKKVIPVLFLILASFATILVTGIILLITYVVGVILFFSNSPLVFLHVYHLAGFANGPKSRLGHCLRAACKSHYGAVGGLARIHVQQSHTFGLFYDIGDLANDRRVAPFRKIGHTFN